MSRGRRFSRFAAVTVIVIWLFILAHMAYSLIAVR